MSPVTRTRSNLLRVATTCAFLALVATTTFGQDSRPRRGRARFDAPPPTLQGSVKTEIVASKLLGRDVGYAVYLPKGYDDPKFASKKYPTLYFLHGLFENYDRFISRGGAKMVDDAIAAERLRPLVVVVPNGEYSFFVDSHDGKQPYARFFFEEFLPFVDKTYRVEAKREARVLMGSSMGGAGALRYAFTRGDLFAGVAAHSAAILPRSLDDVSARAKRTIGFIEDRFGSVFGSPVDPTALRKANPLTVAEDVRIDPKLKIYFDCGDHDRYEFFDGCKALSETLKKRGVAHESEIRSGGHGWDYLNDSMPEGLKFLEKALQDAGAASRPAPAESRPGPKND
jgi:enterochelin esterase-like enzyme